MTKTPTPASHAVNTAPISADLRGMPGLSEQDAALLEQAASMLEGLHDEEHRRGNCSAAVAAACSSDAVRRLAVQLLRAGEPAQCLHQIAEPAEYPFLPQSVGTAVDFMDGSPLDIDWSHPSPNGGTDLYTAAQMRAYVDADRALRAAPASPAQQDALLDLLNRRPAMNAGLAQEYALWNAECYRVMGAIAKAPANAAPAQAVAVPEGWAWVPRNPTLAMMCAAVGPMGRREMFRNMVDAAPADAPTAPSAQEHATQLAGQGPFQQRVQPWMLACFGAEIAGDKQERNHRFLEEAVELVQANGCTAHEAHQLVDYVFGRPVGEPAQEVGGVMVTLAALCLASGMDMHQAGEDELARIWGKVEQIRAKQAAKPKHSPLPAAPAQAQEDARDGLTQAARDVLAERRRQISAKGWTPEHDDEHSDGDIAVAASCYACAGANLDDATRDWPWSNKWWKPGDPRRNLIKSGALILAELERLDRAAARVA